MARKGADGGFTYPLFGTAVYGGGASSILSHSILTLRTLAVLTD